MVKGICSQDIFRGKKLNYQYFYTFIFSVFFYTFIRAFSTYMSLKKVWVNTPTAVRDRVELSKFGNIEGSGIGM